MPHTQLNVNQIMLGADGEIIKPGRKDIFNNLELTFSVTGFELRGRMLTEEPAIPFSLKGDSSRTFSIVV